jgi:nucleoside-diphosphate-sugar epimerase
MADEHYQHAVSPAQPLPPALAGRRFEAVMLLAWPVDPATYLESPANLGAMAATLALAEAVLAAGCPRVVGVGTCAEYAPAMPGRSLLEDDALAPASLYAACKVATHTVLDRLCRQSDATCTWARIFNPFGPGEPPQRLLPSLVATLAGGGEFPAGSGSQIRDYIHVSDVAAALARLLDGGLPGAVNVCSGRGVRLADLMLAAAAACGASDRVRLGARVDRSWDPPHLVGDPGRLLARGWQAREALGLLPDYVRMLRAQPAECA